MRFVSCLVLVAACGGGGGASPDADASSDARVDAPPDVFGDVPVDAVPDANVYPMADAGPTAPVFAGEILKNGDFEVSDGAAWLADWVNFDNNPDGEINVVADPHRFGAHAVQWDIGLTDGYEYFMIQSGIDPSLIVPGQTYELTGWYMFDHTGEVGFNYILRGEPGGEPDINTVPQAIVPVTTVDTWLPFKFDLPIPLGAAPASYRFYLHLIKYTMQPVRMTVDGVSLHPKPAI